ncbi:MAG: LysR family transcriptional regulator [Burkholderiales bacterium]
MDRFQSLFAFAKVVESGSFARAAAHLDRSVSAVSRRVAELEAHLGARLLNRTTRRLSLTESGQLFYERCVQLLADLEEAEEEITASAIVPRGTLKLTASISFGTRHLASAIADFRQQYPRLRFDIELSDRAIDLVDEGVDLAIRIGDIGSQALIGRRIGVSQMICCAAPSYLARHPAPRTPADLASHPCLTYAYSSVGNVWRFSDANHAAHEVKVSGPVHANNGAMLAALAVAGVGVNLEPDFIVADDVGAGRLVPLLTDYIAPSIDVNAAYPSRRHLSAKVRSFIDFLVQRFADNAYGLRKLDLAASGKRATGTERGARGRKHDRR